MPSLLCSEGKLSSIGIPERAWTRWNSQKPGNIFGPGEGTPRSDRGTILFDRGVFGSWAPCSTDTGCPNLKDLDLFFILLQLPFLLDVLDVLLQFFPLKPLQFLLRHLHQIVSRFFQPRFLSVRESFCDLLFVSL